MTEHVRTSYREHRRAAWALVLALAALVAVVVVPLATASGKTYALSLNPATTDCSSPASTVVTVTNTGSPQTLGSIEIYFPPNTVASASLGTLRTNRTSSAQPERKDIIAIDNFNVAAGTAKTVSVTFNAGVTFRAAITAVAKQANRFNDSSGAANLFTHPGSFPTLRVVTCVTVSGRVYQDRNLDNTYTTGSGAFLNSDVPKEWTVELYAKDVDAASYPATPFATTTSSASDGSYTFPQVPTGSDYKVCVTALGGDASSKWSTQSPTGNTECPAISSGGPATAAHRLPNLSANANGRDFLVVPVVGPVGANTPSTTVGGYTVDPSSNSTKADDFYVQDTWVDSQGRTNFRFSPITACTPPSCPPGEIYLLETLQADVTLSSLGGKQVVLRYDDAPPFLDGDLKPMPYCDIDPRAGQPAGQLATSGVLPGSDTSCIVEASQEVVAGGNVTTIFTVYTSYDGGRQIG